MEKTPQKAWKGSTGGTGWMQRSLSVLLRHLDIRILYAVMSVVILFYMLFNHKGYMAMYSFFRRAFGYSPIKAFVNVYRNHYKFGQVILDRFSFYAGNRFDLQIDGYENFDVLNRGEKGFVQLSCHVGNYELAGYSLRSELKKFYALVYSGETETVKKNRTISFDQTNIEMIPVSDDLSHMITMSNALSDGNIVSISADRIFGSAKSVSCKFFGREANIPLGPFAIAVQKNVPVLSVFVVKTGVKAYRIMVSNVEVDPALKRRERMEALAREFVRQMEEVVREYPTQWFNYFDFWQQGKEA